MLTRHADPIVAIATAPGRGAVGIVRISGQQLQPLFTPLLGALRADSMPAREAKYLKFLDSSGQPIDQGLFLYFPAPHSFTGEDVIELQAHGGPVVLRLLVARVLEAAQVIESLNSMRIAQPGEFTERAFLNDKMDLAQAEAVADLIDASTDAAARGAAKSLSGAFSKEVHGLRDALIHLRMLVEATLDFPEEEIEHLSQHKARSQLDALQAALQNFQKKTTQGALLREGIKVVIAGQPNAGKSSLLNALAGAELAIVTPIAGTTRDKVQETISIEGVPLHIVDTAGLRESDDVVEQIGIERTWQEIGGADCLIHLHDGAAEQSSDMAIATETIALRAALMPAIRQKLPKNAPVLHVWNKADLLAANPAIAKLHDEPSLLISVKNRPGIDALRKKLLEVAGWQATGSEGSYIARERHVQAVAKVQSHLNEASLHLNASLAHNAGGLDLLAEELRLAQNALNEITGAFSSNDLLGEIFSRFCIGK
ncbi:MAG: tRNA uridine-5-carboxymethylaminomethyl(34) synthesis GTPase MnmE [Brachymonas sp.]|nr:tRNA uridine-5-carboxymethylaminomethyl(34) synthesis GTPase MnmE [Brachymonas sp.]